MAPMFGVPNFDFLDEEEDTKTSSSSEGANLTHMAFWYMIVLVAMLLLWLVMFFCLRIIALRQKTRSPQPRRMYVGSRARPSLGHQEPTIYVSPSNLPPPPKYEAMAPPSYEEVVGVHYPSFNIQPITQPINTALSNVQSSSNATSNETNNVPSTVINEHGDAPVSIAVSRT